MSDDQPIRYWPPGSDSSGSGSSSFGDSAPLAVTCLTCAQLWHVSDVMAGHRLRCGCGSWLEVPAVSVPPNLPAVTGQEMSSELSARAERPISYRHAPSSHEPIQDVATNMPMEDGTLRHANVDTRRRWTSRLSLELGGILAAFWIPSIVFFFMAGQIDAVIYTPLAGLVSALLVLAIAAGAAHYSFAGLRQPKSWTAYAEALVAAALFLVLARLWLHFLERGLGLGSAKDPLSEFREVLGWGWAFIVIAVFPALCEEFAFRGLIQGRVAALQGKTSAIAITGTAFALAHGVTAAFPIHVAAGFYLCWLRARTESLYPGMLVHLLYNGSLLFLAGTS